MTEENREFHPSTLKLTNKRLPPNAQVREQNRYKLDLEVNHTRQDLVNMVIPRGITVIIHGYSLNEYSGRNGLLITLFGNDITPNILERRDENDLNNFAARDLRVITDKPKELRQVRSTNYNNIRTPIRSEEIAQKAYNLYKTEDGQVMGEL